MDISINYLAILGAGMSSMIIGALWYSPYLFGNIWRKLSGMTDEKIEQAKSQSTGKLYAINFIATLIMSFVLAHFAKIWEAESIYDSWRLAFLLWLGFIVTTALGSVLWEKKPVRLYLINVAYYLIALFVMAIILVLWG